jgi:hypothetical protein
VTTVTGALLFGGAAAREGELPGIRHTFSCTGPDTLQHTGFTVHHVRRAIMPTASRPAFLRHFGRSLIARREPDLADMGTAFALDEAMDGAGRYESSAGLESARPRAVVQVAPWRMWLGKKLGA